MLLALLYTDDDRLDAAALACDQQPLGDAYWRDIYHEQLSLTPDAQTAYVEIQDEELAARLLIGDFASPREAADAVDAYLARRGQLAS